MNRRRVLVAAVAGTALAGGPALPAAAHADLLGTSPEPGERLRTGPALVLLLFDGELRPGAATVAVAGPGARPVGRGAPRVEGTTLVQRVRQDLAPGDYRVSYRAVAADGHVLTGVTGFAVAGDRARVASPGPSAPPGTGGPGTVGPGTVGPGTPSPPTPAGDRPGVPVPALLAGAGGGLLLVLALRTRRRAGRQDD